MVAGHLREQNGYFQMILSWKGADGKRKSKSISTGLAVKAIKSGLKQCCSRPEKNLTPKTC